MLSQLDIYERVSVGIPKVVWNEMTQQIIEAHATRVLEFGSYIKKWKFPEYRVTTCDIEDYPNYIKSVVERYKEELEKGLIKITELSLPSASRFQSVMERAFSKLPPFGGKEKTQTKVLKMFLFGKVSWNSQHNTKMLISSSIQKIKDTKMCLLTSLKSCILMQVLRYCRLKMK